MSYTDEPDIAEAFPRGLNWSNGSDQGGPNLSRRVRPKVDRIRASDINQLRDLMEAMLYHTHYYVDNTGGC